MLSILLTIISLCTLTAANCNNFTKIGNTYTTISNSRRVSVGITCPPSSNNRSCPLQASGYATVPSILNITTTSPSASDLFKTISKSLSTSFDTTVGTFSNVTFYVTPNTSAYAAFTPYLLCYPGVLSDCSEGDVAEGTAVAACKAMKLQGQDEQDYPALNGVENLVQTDAEVVANMTSNPAAAKPAQNVAGRIGDGAVWWWIMLGAGVFAALLL